MAGTTENVVDFLHVTVITKAQPTRCWRMVKRKPQRKTYEKQKSRNTSLIKATAAELAIKLVRGAGTEGKTRKAEVEEIREKVKRTSGIVCVLAATCSQNQLLLHPVNRLHNLLTRSLHQNSSLPINDCLG